MGGIFTIPMDRTSASRTSPAVSKVRKSPFSIIVDTLPQELRELVCRHPKGLYDILLCAAAQAVLKLAMDPHDVGGLVGILCVLHTWTRTLAYHPHGHRLVPAGGVSADRTEWRPARPSYLVPVHALAKLLLDLVGHKRPDPTLPEGGWSKAWVVYGKPTVQGAEQVLHDLGRYVHRIALTNHRLLSLEEGQVSCRYQDSQDQRWRTMTLPADEFIRRFLQHVLPQGFHKIRYYGLWSPVHRPLLHQRQLCLAGHAVVPPPTAPEPASQATEAWCLPLRAGQPCPSCGQRLRVVMRSLPRLQRGPPCAPQLPPGLLSSYLSPHVLPTGPGPWCVRLW
jgi:hypothetical protein